MSNKLSNRLRFYLEIRKALGVFEDVDYSVITGGFAQKNNKLGDVDIVTVVPFISPSIPKSIVQFAKKHVGSQLKESFTPDFEFPTDVVSRQQIVDATEGRTFEVVNGVLRIKNFSKNEITTNPEADYRVWLYEMITHDFDLIGGNFEALIRDTMVALKTTFLWASQVYKYKGSVKIERIQVDIFSAAGLSYKLSEKQSRYLLIMLEEEGLGKADSNDSIILNSKKIEAEVIKLKKLIMSRDSFLTAHILPWEILRRSVEKYKKIK